MNDRKLTVGSLIMDSSYTVETNQDNHLTKSKEEEPIKQSEILISQNTTMFSVKPVNGETLLDSALQQGQSVQYKCKKGTCGRCMVKILKGKNQLNSPNDQEKNKLNEALENGYRLACQTLIIP